MDTKKYISLDKLKTFLSNLRGIFAPLIHKHTLNDISDYKVDTQLSSTSTNPVQNKVVNAEFEVIEAILDNKAEEVHSHAISDITNLQSTLNGKANSSHGTHVTFSSTAPVMDGTASVGSASTVARSDHKHPSDTSRASQTALDSHTSNKTNPHGVTLTQLGLTATSTELNYVDGVTSSIQAQLDGKSATSHTHNYAGSSSVGGSATSAVKLQTARTIGIGTGATGTATSFDGTGNITIPITNIKESYLSWGGKNLSGSVSPIDAACSNIHNANRFAFAKAAGITIEYSTNGSTYSAYSTTDSAKVNLVSGIGSTYYIGARSTSTTVNDKLRITLNATNMGLYTRLRKLLINISTAYSTGSNVIIEKAMKGSETTFTTVGTYSISGWSGWNSIPIEAAFGGGNNQTGNIAVLRLTFGITGINSSQTSNALTIMDIVGIGDTYWSYPSTMAKTGHIYSYDSSQNAIFPANVNASTFSGSGVATVSEVETYLGI